MADAPSFTAYEPSDASPWLIAALAAGVAGFLLLIPGLLMLGYPVAGQQAVMSELPRIPSPRLQIDPAGDLAELRKIEAARLSSYAWVDRNGRIARIPIERAMDILAQRGLPGWPGPRGTGRG